VELAEVMILKILAPVTLALALGLVASPALAQRLDGIAAVVNEEVVLESDVEEQLALFLMRAQAAPDSSMIDTLRRQILNQLIDEKLIVAEAKRQGMTVSDAEVEKQVSTAIAEAVQRMGGPQNFQAQLARENLTEQKLREKYRAEISRQMMAERLVRKQLPPKNVTAAEAEAYFKTNKTKFPRVPPEVRIQVIQIPASADSTVDKKARDQAVAARKRILAGEKFAKVAAEVSEDPTSAKSGGDLGFIGRGALEASVENAAFTLKRGEVSQPVRSAYGWHILETLESDTVKTRAGKDSLDAKGQPAIELHVRHILIRVPVSEADAQRAKTLADRVQQEARKGTDFATLVRRYSKYEGQQGPDGDLGFVSMGSLQPHIRAGLDSLELGQVSEVLPNQVGYNIFKLVDRKPEREYQLEEIRSDLPELVSQMKQRERYDEWVKTLRTKAHIEIRRS
jgi:peptidyl-prolyl cis-trans isomerase SurA